MNCNECLAALETESLREMTPDSPVLQHCATCPDCARLTTMLRDKEYETATVLNSLPPMSNPLTVADYAVSTAKRRRLGRVAVMLSGAALVVTVFLVAMTVVIPAFQDGGGRAPRLGTETIGLTCLSPQQAGDIIEPYIKSERGRYYAPTSGISTITVRGTPAELATARELIRKFEDDPTAACRLPMTIVQRVREHYGGGPVQAGPNPDVVPPNPIAADKATTAPKKQ
jgi:glutaredoxin-related protein